MFTFLGLDIQLSKNTRLFKIFKASINLTLINIPVSMNKVYRLLKLERLKKNTIIYVYYFYHRGNQVQF